MLSGLTGSVAGSRCWSPEALGEWGGGGHGVAMLPETFTLSGGNVKEVVGGLGCLLLVNMTGNKHHGIVFQHGCPSIRS